MTPTGTTATDKVLQRRRAGVLLHISSLPSACGCGTLGESAYRFVDFLAEAGATVWQTLPLGPVDDDLSPYKSISAHAGNYQFIDVELMKKNDWLPEGFHPEGDSYHWPAVADAAFEYFFSAAHSLSAERRKAYDIFCIEQAFWLRDYALFCCLKKYHDNKPWHHWQKVFASRDSGALQQFSVDHQQALQRVYFEQFVFFHQWQALKHYANQKGIFLFGDIAIFVAHDSADVWANPALFQLDGQGNPITVAGVPPDYFSEYGQHWGNPHYHWQAMQDSGFKWWIQRITTQQHCFDIIRIDHFRGLEAFWEIPWPSEDARQGWWTPAPGAALLSAIFQALPEVELVAENLGVITVDVENLRKKFGLAGMAVLQFGFDGNAENPHLLHQQEVQQVVYTGTHDNATSREWYESLDENTRSGITDYLFNSSQTMPGLLINAALSSVAKLAIIPMQDLLSLGSEGRMNTPGTVGKNWKWQFDWQQVSPSLASELRSAIHRYGR